MNINNITIEKIDILGTMEILNKRMRETAIKNTTDKEKIKAYDIGVQNTMECLKSLITHEKEGRKDRLIYQKYEEQPDDFVRYVRLSDTLNELFGK